MTTDFRGVMPALLTPLDKDGTLRVGALEKLIGYEKKKGAYGFYIGGATGEGLLLDLEERKKLAEKSIEFIGADLPKIVHITDMNYRDTLMLARHAEKAGADAIASIPPIYFNYDAEDIYNFYRGIAESVKCPVMIYYTVQAGKTIPLELFQRLFEIDNITAVKWTNPNYYEMIRLRTACPDVNIINGPDEMLICGLSSGASGGIGSTYNVILPLIRKIYDSFTAGLIPQAQEAQRRADKLIAAMLRYSLIPELKLILEELGIPAGYAAAPQKVYSDSARRAMLQDLEKQGLFEIAKP